MKKHLAFVLALLCTAGLIAALPIRGEEQIYTQVVRLHVLAADDSTQAQQDKLAVRDRILDVYGERLAACTDREQAQTLVSVLQGDIRQTATEVLTERGCTDTVAVCFDQEWYPTRDYEGFSLPAGTYLSLRVIIGEGEGQNWWCVLYPPLCLDAATEEVPPGLTDAEYELMTEGPVLRFKVLEWLEELVN